MGTGTFQDPSIYEALYMRSNSLSSLLTHGILLYPHWGSTGFQFHNDRGPLFGQSHFCCFSPGLRVSLNPWLYFGAYCRWGLWQVESIHLLVPDTGPEEDAQSL